MNFSDRELKKAAQQVRRSMLDALPPPEACTPEFSPAFQAKMNKLLLQKPPRSPLKRLARTAAAILLVILVGMSAWLALDLEARAEFASWVVQRFGRYYVYDSLIHNIDGQLPDHGITALPEGWTLAVSADDDLQRVRVYDTDRGRVTLTWFPLRHDLRFVVAANDNDDYLVSRTEILVNGQPADYYCYPYSSRSSSLLWLDDQAGIGFCLMGYLDLETMVQLAESVQPVE